MNWAVIKHALKKLWTWVKNYWYVPALLAYTLVLMVVFRRDGESALRVLDVTRDSYKKQINVLNETHEEEIRKRDEINKKYNKVMEDVESRHDNNLIILNKEKKRRVKDLIERHHDDPEHLTQLLKLTFGIHYEEG